MTYFLKLNFPKNPIKDIQAPEIQVPILHAYRSISPRAHLTDEVYDLFNEIGLKPQYVFLFGSNRKRSTLPNRMIHTDLHIGKTGKWEKFIFGINWEINESHNEFYWWDMSSVEEVWPEEDTPKILLNGIHYGQRTKLGVPDGVKKLDQTVIDGPTLIRTNIPHSTEYYNENYNRLGISIRFDESNFNNWEDVLKKLKSYELVKS
jgi:hypothetical protein